MKLRTMCLLGLFLIVTSCSSPEPVADQPAAPSEPSGPQMVETGIQPMTVPAGNPMTPEKIELGKKLFFDKRLSSTGTMSCETCHLPDMGWTDGKALSAKFDGSLNTRHTPTLYNVGFYEQWYWDGRAATLEGQIMAAWKSQMGADVDQIAATLNGIEGYKTAFETALGGPATPENVTMALASFVRTLRSEDSPWDRYEKGDKAAVSPEAIAGFQVFRASDKANCSLCHLPPLYTDAGFHNTGIGYDKATPDMGRGKILADAGDPSAEQFMGAFKTPTLRSITESGPYFHDGRAKTLEEAVDIMLAGGIQNPNLDEKLKKREITAPEKRALIEFFKALTPEKKPFEKPELP